MIPETVNWRLLITLLRQHKSITRISLDLRVSTPAVSRWHAEQTSPGWRNGARLINIGYSCLSAEQMAEVLR